MTEKFWQEEGSVQSQDLNNKKKVLVRKNRKRFDQDRLAMEEWAAAGFVSEAEKD